MSNLDVPKMVCLQNKSLSWQLEQLFFVEITEYLSTWAERINICVAIFSQISRFVEKQFSEVKKNENHIDPQPTLLQQRDIYFSQTRSCLPEATPRVNKAVGTTEHWR